MTTVRQQIENRLQALQPELLEVIDDSAAHAGHVGAAQHAASLGMAGGEEDGAEEGAAEKSAESHFVLTIVSNAFAGKPLVARHRMIYELLGDLMKTRIHALKIDARAA